MAKTKSGKKIVEVVTVRFSVFFGAFSHPVSPKESPPIFNFGNYRRAEFPTDPLPPALASPAGGLKILMVFFIKKGSNFFVITAPEIKNTHDVNRGCFDLIPIL
jgi:hypothetical protein